jgi:hypothetical protein
VCTSRRRSNRTSSGLLDLRDVAILLKLEVQDQNPRLIAIGVAISVARNSDTLPAPSLSNKNWEVSKRPSWIIRILGWVNESNHTITRVDIRSEKPLSKAPKLPMVPVPYPWCSASTSYSTCSDSSGASVRWSTHISLDSQVNHRMAYSWRSS